MYACTLGLLLACRVSARLLFAVLAVCARMSRQRPSVTLVVCIWLPEWVACRLIGVLLRQEGVCLRFCSRWCVPTGYGVMDTVARARGGVRNTSGFTVMSPPGAPGGCGEARGVPHLGQAKPQ